MVVRMRSTRSHTGNRRSHHALKAKGSSACANCGTAKLRHTMCANCGMYNGRKVVDTSAKVLKKEKKAKETGLVKSK